MQLSRCPMCHCRINLEALIQDDAGRDLLALVAKLDKTTAAALIGYIGLFRSASRDLTNDRALRLSNEVLALGEINALRLALNHTLESMRAKQAIGQFKPLTNHNYLKRVLENHTCEAVPGISIESTVIEHHDPRTTRRKITSAIMDINDTNW